MRKLLTSREAAAMIGIAPATLRSWRHRGKGPAFKQLTAGGQVAYEPEVVELWILRNPNVRTQKN